MGVLNAIAARRFTALPVLVLRAAVGIGMTTVAMAQPAAPAAEPIVYTRARVVSVLQEPGTDGKLYVRLKLVPNAKLPFATHAFRVADRALLKGISEGAWVRFTARRIDGENTLTGLELAEACRRLEPCT